VAQIVTRIEPEAEAEPPAADAAAGEEGAP